MKSFFGNTNSAFLGWSGISAPQQTTRIEKEHSWPLFKPFTKSTLYFRACSALEVYANEPDRLTRIEIDKVLSESFRTFQARHTRTRNKSPFNLAPFYERLIIAIQSTGSDEDRSSLTKLGLNIARQEKHASSMDFLSWVIDGLVASHQDHFVSTRRTSEGLSLYAELGDLEALGRAVEILNKAGKVEAKHPELLTARYVELCCAFGALKQIRVQPEKLRDHPHEIPKRIRLESQLVGLNKSITKANHCGRNELLRIVRQCQKGKIPTPPIRLFSARTIDTLKRAQRSNTDSVLGRAAPKVLRAISSFTISRGLISTANNAVNTRKPQPG